MWLWSRILCSIIRRQSAKQTAPTALLGVGRLETTPEINGTQEGLLSEIVVTVWCKLSGGCKPSLVCIKCCIFTQRCFLDDDLDITKKSTKCVLPGDTLCTFWWETYSSGIPTNVKKHVKMGDKWKTTRCIHCLMNCPKYFPSLWESSSFFPSPDIVEVDSLYEVHILGFLHGWAVQVSRWIKILHLGWIKKMPIILSLEFIKTIKASFSLRCLRNAGPITGPLFSFFSLLPLILFPSIDFVLFAQETKKIQSSCSFLIWPMKLPGSTRFFRLMDEYFYFTSSRLK